MDNSQGSVTSKHRIRICSFLFTAVVSLGAHVQAQQAPKLSAPYAKAARLSLLAIQSDASAPQDQSNEAIAAEVATERTIDAADEKAVTNQEKSVTETLRQIYPSKLRDNGVIRAYDKLIEIDNADSDDVAAEDGVDPRTAKKHNDYAVAQYTDAEAAIRKREDGCFTKLQESLLQRSPDVTACAEWIQKSSRTGKN
jgi:hypothetical protein